MPVARSLRGRVIVWVGVALAVLFTVTILALDLSYRRIIEISREDLLEAQLLGLIALADADPNGELTLPADAINPQFTLVDSGLYGVLWDVNGKVTWESQSLIGRAFPDIESPGPGEQRFFEANLPGLPRLSVLVMGIRWELDDGTVKPYTIATAVSLAPYDQQVREFQRNLISWFAGVTLIMILVVLGVLGWVLRPLRKLAVQVAEVEEGERTHLSGDFPTELVGLAGNLNALIETERRRLTRYRNTLDDLAHSLKTPLAAMKTLLSETVAGRSQTDAINRELDRITQRVTYQLRRARAGGATGLGVEPIKVAPLIVDLKETLDKVYFEKSVEAQLRITGEPQFQGDPGDLTEILGNLMENAYKYCRQHVLVAAWQSGQRLIVTIDDDGRGMKPDELEALVERGSRADQSLPGEGIGLAVVRETAQLYAGSLEIVPTELGGTKLRVELARAGSAA